MRLRKLAVAVGLMVPALVAAESPREALGRDAFGTITECEVRLQNLLFKAFNREYHHHAHDIKMANFKWVDRSKQQVAMYSDDIQWVEDISFDTLQKGTLLVSDDTQGKWRQTPEDGEHVEPIWSASSAWNCAK